MKFTEWARSLDDKAFPRPKANTTSPGLRWQRTVLAGPVIVIVLLFVPPVIALPVSVVVVSFYVWRAFRPTKNRTPQA